jgi:hypothetical protein
MLPAAYETPAAILILLGGVLACFTGHRLFKTVLAIYGFILGAMMTSSLFGSSNVAGMLAGAVAGGLVGAVVLMFAYFIGIALIGAGLGALLAHVAWRQASGIDPPPAGIVVSSAVGAIAAMMMQRYVIIVGTAFAGAWTVLVGSLALWTSRAGKLLTSSDVWILYPLGPARGDPWVPFAWIGLGLVGTIVQLRLGGKRK